MPLHEESSGDRRAETATIGSASGCLPHPSRRRAEAFTGLVGPHLPWLRALARRLARDGADDLLQECLVKAYRRFDQLRDPQAVGAWLQQILLNLARDRARRRERSPEEVPLEDGDGAVFARLAASSGIEAIDGDGLHLDAWPDVSVADVWAVLDQLAEHYRAPLVLVHMYGVPTREAARALGMPVNTLLSRLHRGRKRFAEALWDYGRRHGGVPAFVARSS